MPGIGLNVTTDLSRLERRAAMRPLDKKAQARKIVSERLRSLFDHWEQQSASDAEALWERAEARLDEEKMERGVNASR
jgi:hypothetical protein